MEFTDRARRVILFLMNIVPRLSALVVVAAVLTGPGPAMAFDPAVLEAVVRLKPDWSPAARGVDARGAPRDPEGTGVAVLPGGYVATNVHVIGDAARVRAMTHDGRVLDAEIVGRHLATDIALLRLPIDLPVLETAPPPPLAGRVCAVGNQFGLGLSVTCGVVSAVNRSGTGFNPVEDFIQTDAAVNPGGSGGALVDAQSRLIGLVSAIFTKESDADIGVNFAASVRLVMRVATDLRDHGRVRRADVGFRAGPVPPPLSAAGGGAMVTAVDVDGPALAAGIEAGDIVTRVDGAPVPTPAALEAALFMVRPGETIGLTARRGDVVREVTVATPAPAD